MVADADPTGAAFYPDPLMFLAEKIFCHIYTLLSPQGCNFQKCPQTLKYLPGKVNRQVTGATKYESPPVVARAFLFHGIKTVPKGCVYSAGSNLTGGSGNHQ
jgi:hypothetical protein